jgi:hypothetical protein
MASTTPQTLNASIGAVAAPTRAQAPKIRCGLIVECPREVRMKPYGGESPLSRLHLGWSGPAISVPIGRRWLVGTP